MAICLAVLRRDGFISLDPTDTKDIIQTKPFTVSGYQLFVNVDAAYLRITLSNSASTNRRFVQTFSFSKVLRRFA